MPIQTYSGRTFHISGKTMTVLPRPNPNVLCKRVSEGSGVLLDMQHEVYFGLNQVGMRVWELLPPACADLAELIDRLTGDYPEVSRATIQADVSELLGALRDNSLVGDPEG